MLVAAPSESLLLPLPLTFYKRQILDCSKLKELADDNFKFNESGRKFSKSAENTVGKGEIVRYEQFLLFPQCFQKTCPANTYRPGLVWERVKDYFVKQTTHSCTYCVRLASCQERSHEKPSARLKL